MNDLRPKVIFASMPRSGSLFMARILQHCDLAVRHESINPVAGMDLRLSHKNAPERDDSYIVVSCYTPPLLYQLHEGCIIAHQTRDPRKCIASLESIRHNNFWCQWINAFGYQEVWSVYNRLIEGAIRPDLHYVQYQIERLAPKGLQAILGKAGIDVNLSVIERAFENRPRRIRIIGRVGGLTIGGMNCLNQYKKQHGDTDMPRNDVLCKEFGEGSINLQDTINSNLALMRDAFTKPMPLPYFDDLADTPSAANWDQCLCVIVSPGGTTDHLGDRLFFSEDGDWHRLDDSDEEVSGSDASDDVVRPVSMPSLSSGAEDWELAANLGFQHAKHTITRPWPIPSFSLSSLPDPADWEWCLIHCPDPKATPTYSERILLSDGADWLALDGGNDSLGGSASIGSRPDLGSDLAAINFASSWSLPFSAWQNAWNLPLPVPFWSQVEFYEEGYGWNPELWPWSLAIITDPESSSGRADEHIVVSDGTDWLRVRDSTPPIVDLLDGLISWWKLEESSGTRFDAHGSNDLTDNNTVGSTTGVQGDGADFESSNSEYLSILDNASLSFGDEELTISAWVNLESKAADMGIVGKWRVVGNDREYQIAYSSALDRFIFQVSSNGTAETTAIANNLGSPSTGTWYHIIAQHNPTSDVIAIKVNGGTPNSAAYSAGLRDGAASFLIGAANNGIAAFLDGIVDEVAIWDRVLSSKEMEILYNSGLGLTYGKES